MISPSPEPVPGNPDEFWRLQHSCSRPPFRSAMLPKAASIESDLMLDNAPPFSFFMQWQVQEVAFYNKDQRVEVGGPLQFHQRLDERGFR